MFLVIEKTHDNMDFVLAGPMNWRPSYFKAVLRDDLEINYNVPLSNDTNDPIIINEVARIIPVTDIGIVGDYNSKIHNLDGPKYNMSELSAEMYHLVVDKPIEIVKSELKSIIAANRYRYEVMGVKVTIQNKELSLLTTREDRGLYLQAYQLGKDNISWKFNEDFVSLSNSELGIIVEAVATHVQAAFDWESTKHTEIDSKTTLTELDSIVLISDNPIWEPVTNVN